MPVSFAPGLAPLPSPPVFTGGNAASALSRIAPFIRPGTVPLSAPLPALPPLPPAPVLPPLTLAPTTAPTIGVGTAIGTGAAVVGAAALGLGLGNLIYEDLLGRPFGPSIGDLYFPFGQPLPVPLPQSLPFPFAGGQCVTIYLVGGTGTYYSSTDKIYKTRSFSSILLKGPITNPQVVQDANIVRWFIDGFDRFTSQPVTRQLSAVTSSIGTVSQGAFTSVTTSRSDSQPDNCGSYIPLPATEPKALARPTLPRPDEIPLIPAIPRIPELLGIPGEQPFRLPTGSTEGAPQRLLEPSSMAVPTQLPIPFYAPLPVPGPLPETEPETPNRRPPTPTLECCPSLERKLDQLLEQECPDPCDFTEIEQLLEQVLEKLSGETAGQIDTSICEAEEPTAVTYQGSGLDGLYSAVDAIATSLSTIHGNTNCPDEPCVSSIPDWWQVRKGADTPQLSVVFRKAGTRNYHSLNIPHPIISPKPATCAIDPYEAGQWQATIYLSDNSKFICCANLKGEAIRVATQAASMIQSEFLPNPLQIATTERRGFAVNKSSMEPRYMDYHPEGQKSRIAQWRVRL